MKNGFAIRNLLLLGLAVIILGSGCATFNPGRASRGRLDQALLQASAVGDAATVGRCLGEGANVNAMDTNQSTSLCNAAAGGHFEVARLLLEAGAEVDGRDGVDGNSPLHLAVDAGIAQPALVRLLLDRGAPVNALTQDRSTPLHLAAARACQKAALPLLLQHGALVNARNKGGLTPLHYAALCNPDPAVAEQLLAAGADVNARDNGGWPPLRYALGADPAVTPAVVAVLLNHGADARAGDRTGFTPLHQAANKVHFRSLADNQRVIGLLLSKGADVNAKDKNGQMPVDEAKKAGSPEIAKLLSVKGAR